MELYPEAEFNSKLKQAARLWRAKLTQKTLLLTQKTLLLLPEGGGGGGEGALCGCAWWVGTVEMKKWRKVYSQ
jgi:hypothetical protein